MAVTQINSSFQNDGNFSQLDLQNINGVGPVMRIETFRCSQPQGEFGETKAGTSVSVLAGKDHLSSDSNRVFRHFYSTGKLASPKLTLEMRETFDEEGFFEIRVRDVDYESQSFGSTLIMSASPQPHNYYSINYEMRVANQVEPAKLFSPLKAPITEIVNGFHDLSDAPDDLGKMDSNLPGNPINTKIKWNGKKSDINAAFKDFRNIFKNAQFEQWARNIQNYERMGDFRDKCIHDGTNLTGPNPDLASEFLLIRAYRASLIGLGVVADQEMTLHTKGDINLLSDSIPVKTDPKPGVYSVFLSAFLNNIGIYQLGIDKVHSDYGGIPMTIAPGSRLEDASKPIVDSSRFNRALAELAFAFYVGPDLPALPALIEMDIQP